MYTNIINVENSEKNMHEIINGANKFSYKPNEGKI